MSCQCTYTLYGSRGSDVRVILNVTLDLTERKESALLAHRCWLIDKKYNQKHGVPVIDQTHIFKARTLRLLSTHADPEVRRTPTYTSSLSLSLSHISGNVVLFRRHFYVFSNCFFVCHNSKRRKN